MRNNEPGSERGLKPTEHFNAGNKRVFVDAPKGYPGKKYIGGRYAYRYQVDQWRKTGKVPNPHTTVIHHLDEAHDTPDYKFTRKSDEDVVAESRRYHYTKDHGAPFSKRRATGRR